MKADEKYKAGNSSIDLRYGYFNDDDGFFIEQDSKSLKVVLRKNGKDYKQTADEFISNCNKLNHDKPCVGKEGESCRKNNKCIYPECKKS